MPQPVAEPEKSLRPKSLGQDRFGLTLHEIKGRGLRVEAVAEGSLAARSDFELQDLITQVDSRPVRSASECLAAIQAALARGGFGGALLQVERQGRRTFILLRSN